MNIVEVFEETARRRPYQKALIDGERFYYGEHDLRAKLYALLVQLDFESPTELAPEERSLLEAARKYATLCDSEAWRDVDEELNADYGTRPVTADAAKMTQRLSDLETVAEDVLARQQEILAAGADDDVRQDDAMLQTVRTAARSFTPLSTCVHTSVHTCRCACCATGRRLSCTSCARATARRRSRWSEPEHLPMPEHLPATRAALAAPSVHSFWPHLLRTGEEVDVPRAPRRQGQVGGRAPFKLAATHVL